MSLERPNVQERTLTLKCSTSGIAKWKQIRFYNNGTEIFMAKSFSKIGITEISITIQRTAAVYSCNYQVQKLGRLIDSQPSKNVHVSVLGKSLAHYNVQYVEINNLVKITFKYN